MKNRIYFPLLMVLSFSLFAACSSDDLSANVTLTEGVEGTIGGDFTGNGGDTSQTFNWQNDLTTADYNADITATSSGLFQIIVLDSEGNTMLDRSLNGNQEPDTFSGVTSAGEPGMWSVTINLSNFSGDGSFTLTEGD
jgi:hypothetical protein